MLRRTTGLCFVLCLVAIIVSVAFPREATARAANAAIADADWPQLGRDPQRTSASPQSVTGPYRYYWRWTDVPIADRAQQVISNGILYVGALTGVMYGLDAAYDAEGSSPRIIWQANLHSPVRAGAGVDTGDNVVVVGTQDGTIYGLDGGSGTPIWAAPTAGSIVAAPLITNGIAYVGSSSGVFYAIRTADGSVLWQQSLGVPILGSAAMSGDESTVFVVAENVTAYALASATGTLSWQTQLQGQSDVDRWPVVLGNSVVFRTQPLGFFHDLLNEGDATLTGAGTMQSDWAADWSLVRPATLGYLTANPASQTFFDLDVATGQSHGLAPVLYTAGANDAPSPPIVYNQAFYLGYRPRHGIQNDAVVDVHTSSKYDADLGKLDPTTLDFTGVKNTNTFTYQFRMTSDESVGLTVAGDLLLVDNFERLGGVNLVNGSLTGLAQVSLTCPAETWIDPNENLIPFYESCPWIGSHVSEGNARVGAAVASGRIFWHIQKSGLASIGPAGGVTNLPQPTPTPQPTASPLPGPTPVSTQMLVSYVWTAPQRPVAAPADLNQLLIQEITKIVSVNQHLLPFYLQRGMDTTGSWPPDVSNGTEPTLIQNSQVYWYDPGELIYTLSIAYPYLPPTLQAQVLAYLQSEMNRYPPLQSLPYPPTSWLTQGAAREPYPVPFRNSNWNAWPPPGVPLQTLYALWAYGQYTGDWTYLSTHWAGIQALFNAKSGSIDSYAEIAGAIGYSRIALQLGHPSDVTAGQNAAVTAMQNGYNFSSWLNLANTMYPPNPSYSYEAPGRKGQVFFGLVPEVGNYLHDTNLPAVQATVNDVAGYPNGSYLWYVTRLGPQAEISEVSYHTPEVGWSIFLAEAYSLHEYQNQLRAWLDRPWGLGDMWYLQKLIATIEANPTPPFSSSLSVVK